MAVTGLYFYDAHAPAYAREQKPERPRRARDHRPQPPLPAQGQLHVEELGRGFAWLDTGTHESLLQAATFVETVEQRQGLKIGAPEEVAWAELAAGFGSADYGRYLLSLLEDR
jgi:glucose-1-phosphate thymidylyltransferase